LADGVQVGNEFGASVAVSGDTALIGAFLYDYPPPIYSLGRDWGSAYVFVRDGTSWTQQAKLLADDGAANKLFGNSVAMSGGTSVIGPISGVRSRQSPL
jgi:hypothetical protein